jgi:hypothetical protein
MQCRGRFVAATGVNGMTKARWNTTDGTREGALALHGYDSQQLFAY